MEVIKYEGFGRFGVVRLGDYFFRIFVLVGIDFILFFFNFFFYFKELGEYDFNFVFLIFFGFYIFDEVIQKVIGRLWSVNYDGFNVFYFFVLRRMEYFEEFFKIIDRYNFDVVYFGNLKILIKEYCYFVRILREFCERFLNVMIIVDFELFFYLLVVYFGIDVLIFVFLSFMILRVRDLFSFFYFFGVMSLIFLILFVKLYCL